MKLLHRLLQHLLVAVAAVATAGAADQTLFDYFPPAISNLSVGDLGGYEVGNRYTHPVNAGPVIVKSVSFINQTFGSGTAEPGELRVRIYSSTIVNGVSVPNNILAEAWNTMQVHSTGTLADPPLTVNFTTELQLQPGSTYFVIATARKNLSEPIGNWNSWEIGLGMPTSGVGFEGAVVRSASSAQWNKAGIAFAMNLIGSVPAPLPGRGVAAEAISGGATFTGVYSPAINDSGTVALRAKFAGTGITSLNDTGIFLHKTSSVLLAREGDAAQGTSATFAGFGDPVINSDNEVAFSATLQRDEAATTKLNDQGIWTNLDGSLALAIREGDQAPGLPSGVLFKKISWIHLGKDGLYVGAYAAAADGTVKANGIWEFADGTLTKVVAAGDTVPTAAGPQTVRSLGKPAGAGTGNAQSRVASSSGKLAIIVTTTQGRSDVTVFE